MFRHELRYSVAEAQIFGLCFVHLSRGHVALHGHDLHLVSKTDVVGSHLVEIDGELVNLVVIGIDDITTMIEFTLLLFGDVFEGSNTLDSVLELTLVKLEHAEFDIVDDDRLVFVVNDGGLSFALALVVLGGHGDLWGRKQIGK